MASRLAACCSRRRWSLLSSRSRPESGAPSRSARFAVRDAGGAFVRDGTVKVAVVAQDGSVVVGPLSASSSPADGVAILADAYHANLQTSNIPNGRYHIRVTFDS